MTFSTEYNERLFKPGSLRSMYHRQRFHWISKVLGRLNCQPASVFELGCFDGRLLDYLPRIPERYVGFDAGWEGGVEVAQNTRSTKSVQFVRSTDPSDLATLADGSFEVAISLETFEHIAPAQVDAYVDQLGRLVAGYLLISVPNEKGITLLVRQAVKKLMSWTEELEIEKYTARELFYAAICSLDRLPRYEHKGFDYATLAKQVGRQFEIMSVEGIPSRWLPAYLSFAVGIVARTRQG